MAVTHKIAMAQQPLPIGWNFEYIKDGFVGPNNEFISRNDVQIHGSFHKAYAHVYGPAAAPVVGTHSRPSGNLTHGDYQVSSISLESPKNFVFRTLKGDITINLQTADITIPPGIGRDEAIRDFWLGFQRHYLPNNSTADTKQLEMEISQLKKALDGVNWAKREAEKESAEAKKDSVKKVAEKIRKKYSGEKFIMVKPEDLIKFIEDDK